jgi:hypothetical protein
MPAALIPTKKRLDELRELAEFFQAWFGDKWERKTELRAGLFRTQITGVLRGEEAFSAYLLPRLRAVRARLLASVARYG